MRSVSSRWQLLSFSLSNGATSASFICRDNDKHPCWLIIFHLAMAASLFYYFSTSFRFPSLCLCVSCSECLSVFLCVSCPLLLSFNNLQKCLTQWLTSKLDAICQQFPYVTYKLLVVVWKCRKTCLSLELEVVVQVWKCSETYLSIALEVVVQVWKCRDLPQHSTWGGGVGVKMQRKRLTIA